MGNRDSGRILERLKSLYPKSIDLTLGRPKRLLAELEHPERSLPPVIHFAGTNGKGSILAMVRAGMEAASLDVHTYISPHLTQFHERIRLSGELIRENHLASVLTECERINAGKPISLFEITTCAAFLAFSRTPADVLLLEVGLGGRLDATNVVDRPELTVISPVSLDHQEHLGESLADIAAEKAGIMKPGVPCVVSRQEPEALRRISEIAQSVGAPLLLQDRDWTVKSSDSRIVHKGPHGELELPRPGLVGPHQVENAGAAIMVLSHLGFGRDAIASAMTDAVWPARMQLLKRGPLVDAASNSEIWLDGGHNPAAGLAVASTFRSMPDRATRIICGMLGTKDIRSFLGALRTVADRLYGITIPGEPAALPAANVAQVARELGFKAEAAPNAEHAARKIASEEPESRILVCGSLYLAGRVLQENI